MTLHVKVSFCSARKPRSSSTSFFNSKLHGILKLLVSRLAYLMLNHYHLLSHIHN